MARLAISNINPHPNDPLNLHKPETDFLHDHGLIRLRRAKPGGCPAIDARAVQAIQDFLATYPLDRFIVPDQNLHNDPDETFGTIVLPLWQQTPEFHASSEKWPTLPTYYLPSSHI